MRTATVGISCGNWDDHGYRTINEVLRNSLRNVDLFCSDRPSTTVDICIIVQPQGMELERVRKTQVAIAVVKPSHPYPTSLLNLGFDSLCQITNYRNIPPKELQQLITKVQSAIEILNWRAAVLGEEPYHTDIINK